MPERSSSVHSPATTSRPPEETAPLITLRALILGTLTIAAMFYYIIQVAERLGLGSYVHSQYPMAAFIPFVLCSLSTWRSRTCGRTSPCGGRVAHHIHHDLGCRNYTPVGMDGLLARHPGPT